MKKFIFLSVLIFLVNVGFSQRGVSNFTEYRTVVHNQTTTASVGCVMVSLQYEITLSNGTIQTITGNNSYEINPGQTISNLNITIPANATINTRYVKFTLPNNNIRLYNITDGEEQAFSNNGQDFCPGSQYPSRILLCNYSQLVTYFCLTFM